MTTAVPLEPPTLRAPPRLSWIEVDGEVHHVSDFADFLTGQRPVALCPACREPVTLKLGSVRAHHAAHQPDSTCVAAGRRAQEINERFTRIRRRKSELDARAQDEASASPAYGRRSTTASLGRS